MSITLDGTNGITTPDVDSTTSVTTPLVTSSGALALSTTSANAIIASTNGVERMRIDSAGNVGIGTSSPVFRLESVLSSTDTVGTANASVGLSLKNTNTTGNYVSLNFGNSVGQGAAIQGFSVSPSSTSEMGIRFSTRNSGGTLAERMRITSAGNVLVGTATDPASGRIVSMGLADGSVFTFISDQSPRGTLSTGHIRFVNSNGPVGQISTSGSSTSYNTSSDYRLKENVTPLSDATDRLMQIPVHRFNFIADPDTVVDGFLAHEVQPYVPEAITGTKDEVDDEGNPVYQGIDQSKLVPLLTAALQEALQKIEALTARITALETAND